MIIWLEREAEAQVDQAGMEKGERVGLCRPPPLFSLAQRGGCQGDVRVFSRSPRWGRQALCRLSFFLSSHQIFLLVIKAYPNLPFLPEDTVVLAQSRV